MSYAHSWALRLAQRALECIMVQKVDKLVALATFLPRNLIF